MSNENCLAGLRCPACDSEGPFKISSKCWAVVNDDGVDETTEVEWDGDSAIVCVGCGEMGIVSEFTRKETSSGRSNVVRRTKEGG